jgi:hypothetical protein
MILRFQPKQPESKWENPAPRRFSLSGSMRPGAQIGGKVAKHVCDNFFQPVP